MSKFSFGDILENERASEDNPLRLGIFVREGWRKGKLNPGRFLLLTDCEGKFWEISGDNNRIKKVGSVLNARANIADPLVEAALKGGAL